MSTLKSRPLKPLEEGGWDLPPSYSIRHCQHPATVAMESDQPQSHDDSQQDGNPGSESLPRKHKKGVNPLPRRSTRLQLHSVQSHRIPATIKTKSSLPLSAFHSNNIARIYRRSAHKNFPFLVRDLETQRRQLIGTGKNLEDSDDNQSPYTTPTASDNSDINSISEASEDSLSAPSDTELFGLRAKSLSPKPISLEPSSSSNSATSPETVAESSASESSASPPSPSLSTSYVPSSRFSSDG